MKIKRFIAPDMRQAIRQVRDALGMDAVILSSKAVAEGIELIAAIDFDAESLTQADRNDDFSREHQDPKQRQSITKETESSIETPWPKKSPLAGQAVEEGSDGANTPMVEALQRELASMRSLLEGQLARLAWNEFSRERPRQAEVVMQLERLGLDRELGIAIAETGPATSDYQQAWRAALGTLARRLPLSKDEITERGGRLALIGPTGAGKTTTLAKLAARHVMRQGRNTLALINMDAYRIGAQAQLNTLGQLLGVPVFQADSSKALETILDGLNEKRLILIDTPGMPSKDSHANECARSLRSIDGIELYVVMAANMARSSMSETLSLLASVRPEGAVLTKIDEAHSLGEAFSAFMENGGPPLRYVGTGQRIAEDFEPANVQRLLVEAIELAKKRKTENSSVTSWNHRQNGGQRVYAE